MSTGNFLSALVQRGVQAAGGALEGQVIGKHQAMASARQARQDELDRAMTESRMKTEGAQQAGLAREAADYVPHAQKVTEAYALRQQEHRDRLEEIRAQGVTARDVARVRLANSGRADPRVAVETQNIANFQAQKTAAQKTADDAFLRMRDPAGAAAADSTVQAMGDSIAVHRGNRNALVGLDGDGEDGKGGQDTAPPTGAKPLSVEDYDYLVSPAGGLTRQRIIANGYSIPPGR